MIGSDTDGKAGWSLPSSIVTDPAATETNQGERTNMLQAMVVRTIIGDCIWKKISTSAEHPGCLESAHVQSMSVCRMRRLSFRHQHDAHCMSTTNLSTAGVFFRNHAHTPRTSPVKPPDPWRQNAYSTLPSVLFASTVDRVHGCAYVNMCSCLQRWDAGYF